MEIFDNPTFTGKQRKENDFPEKFRPRRRQNKTLGYSETTFQ